MYVVGPVIKWQPGPKCVSISWRTLGPSTRYYGADNGWMFLNIIKHKCKKIVIMCTQVRKLIGGEKNNMYTI